MSDTGGGVDAAVWASAGAPRACGGDPAASVGKAHPPRPGRAPAEPRSAIVYLCASLLLPCEDVAPEPDYHPHSLVRAASSRVSQGSPFRWIRPEWVTPAAG